MLTACGLLHALTLAFIDFSFFLWRYGEDPCRASAQVLSPVVSKPPRIVEPLALSQFYSFTLVPFTASLGTRGAVPNRGLVFFCYALCASEWPLPSGHYYVGSLLAGFITVEVGVAVVVAVAGVVLVVVCAIAVAVVGVAVGVVAVAAAIAFVVVVVALVGPGAAAALAAVAVAVVVVSLVVAVVGVFAIVAVAVAGAGALVVVAVVVVAAVGV